MQQKRIHWKLYILYGIVIAYLGYFVGGAYEKGDNVFSMYQKLVINMEHPFANYWNSYSIFWILGFLVIYSFYVMMQVLDPKNYMHHKEYGSSKFANPATINKELADHDNKREDNIVIKKKKLW